MDEQVVVPRAKKGNPGSGRGKCKVCLSPHRAAIDLALVARRAPAAISRQYGITKQSLHRHARNHLTPAQRAAFAIGTSPSPAELDKLARSEESNLLANLATQRGRLTIVSDLALFSKRISDCVQAENAILRNLQATASILGMIVSKREVTVQSVLLSSDYTELRATILRALMPFPKAKQAVAAALAVLENKAADDIRSGDRAVVIDVPAELVELPYHRPRKEKVDDRAEA